MLYAYKRHPFKTSLSTRKAEQLFLFHPRCSRFWLLIALTVTTLLSASTLFASWTTAAAAVVMSRRRSRNDVLLVGLCLLNGDGTRGKG